MSLRQAMLELMDAIAKDIVVQEAAACEILDVAAKREAAGYVRDAATLRTLSRWHRVKALKLQAHLVTLNGEYDGLCRDADGKT